MARRAARAALVAVAALALLAGCTPAIASGSTGTDGAGTAPLTSLVVDGTTRSYLLRAPDEAAERAPMPLVIVLHGAGGNGKRAEDSTGLTPLARSAGFLVAYPYGSQAANVPGEFSWNAGACCGVPSRSGVDDVAFVDAVITDVASRYPVDATRVFVFGFSNGGMLTYRLACELGSRFAAAAVVSGALNVPDCAAPDPMDLLVVHGDADTVVPYAGGPAGESTAARFGAWQNASVADSVAFWRRRDGCERGPLRVTEESTTTDEYTGCADGHRLRLVTIRQGVHRWPTEPTMGFDASGEILRFFGLL